MAAAGNDLIADQLVSFCDELREDTATRVLVLRLWVGLAITLRVRNALLVAGG